MARDDPDKKEIGETVNTATTCPYCGVGCGVIAKVDEAGEVTVEGDAEHPANFGKLCSKGSTLHKTLGNEDRLLYPSIDGERASWDEALDKTADKFASVIAEHGPDAVAFYVSGQILTEDYYIANKLMKGFIGSGNIDTNSRLCMASSVVGHKRAFGSDTVPGCYEDLELADLLVLTGSNLAWCHPILYQRIMTAKEARPEMKIIVIDPRETASCDLADLHLPLAPGSDIALFQGLLKFLVEGGHSDMGFINGFTENAAKAIAACANYDVETVSQISGLSPKDLGTFYAAWAKTEKTVTIYSQGVNQATDGSDKVNAILNCHLLTGRIGKPGSGPFSVTGQPNAMGGREVGGLANQLASHMEIGNPAHRDLVQRFWNSPTIADKNGALAVEMFDKVHSGQIKAIWIMATNPVDSLPNADHVREALGRAELVVVSDIYAHTDTAACADIVLPATAWGEKTGTVTNSERRISRQRSFLKPPGEAKHDWWQLCEVAKRMGFGEAFDFESPAEIFREYASLCAFENGGSRDLNLSGLKGISDEAYDALDPIQWPVIDEEDEGCARMFADGHFFTPSQRARFVVPGKSKLSKTSEAYPLILNTGRIRDHWHTMTRTGRAAQLSNHISEPYVDISPEDALRLGLADADIAKLTSPFGMMLARTVVTKRQKTGAVFAPIHFTDRFASMGRVDVLPAPDVDPASGQPAYKISAVKAEKFAASWYGFAALCADVFEDVTVPDSAQYWAKSRVDAGLRIELAGLETPDGLRVFLADLLDQKLGGAVDSFDILEMQYAATGQTRLAYFDADGTLLALLFTSPHPVALSRDWACRQLGTQPEGIARHLLLAGRPGADMPDKGAIVCSCMNIGVNEITDAIISGGCHTVEAICGATTAGTNCGSCKPELRAILKEQSFAQASE